MAVIEEVLVEHFQELASLWAQRCDAICSVDYEAIDIVELDQRIDAHMQGLIVAGEQCVPFAVPLLEEEDVHLAFAAAWCLAKIGHVDEVLDRMTEVNLDGVAEALCHSEIEPFEGTLKSIYRDAEPEVASAVGLVLATHRRMPKPNRLDEFYDHEDPQVRTRAWRSVSRSCGK